MDSSIISYIDLKIENYIKGTPFTKDNLQIITLGGRITLGGEIIPGEDEPIFHEGKKVRIYFKEINGEFSIVCAFLGVEEI